MKPIFFLLAIFLLFHQGYSQSTKTWSHNISENTLSMTGISANAEIEVQDAMEVEVIDNAILQIRIYPNNKESEIVFVMPDITEWDVIVSDTRGNMVEQLKGFEAKSFYINIEDYKQGQYIIKVVDKKRKAKLELELLKNY